MICPLAWARHEIKNGRAIFPVREIMEAYEETRVKYHNEIINGHTRAEHFIALARSESFQEAADLCGPHRGPTNLYHALLVQAAKHREAAERLA